MIVLYSVLTLGILGLISGCMLSYAAKKFHVPVDPRVEELAGVLPGANCGACGYASCVELAKAILKGEAAANGCIAGGSDVAEEVAKVLGKPPEETVFIKKTAVVQCRGGKAQAREKFKYTGIENCSAAMLIAGGHKACIYGCLGLGDCAKICPFDAIKMGPDGIPVIDDEKCTACGKCVEVCPRNIIALIPKDQAVFIACVSKDKAKRVKEVCSVGCITCGICVSPDVSSSDVITMRENIPEIHWRPGQDLRKLLENAVKKCPNKCFMIRG